MHSCKGFRKYCEITEGVTICSQSVLCSLLNVRCVIVTTDEVFLYITSSAEGVQNSPDRVFTGHQQQYLNKVGCISQDDGCRTLPVTFVSFEVPPVSQAETPKIFSRMVQVTTHFVGCLPANSVIGRP